MSWIAGGFFRPMLHQVADNADQMFMDYRRYWWATCDAVCVVLPADASLIGPWCPKCFPDQAAIDKAMVGATCLTGLVA